MLPFPPALNTQDGIRKTSILCPRGIFKLSLFRISRVTTFPLIWFDYLSRSSELYFSLPFRLRKSLAKWPQTLDLPVGVIHLCCFSFLPWGCSIVLPFNQTLIFFVCGWCRIPCFYTVAGLYLMYLVQRQLSFAAFIGNSKKAPCN